MVNVSNLCFSEMLCGTVTNFQRWSDEFLVWNPLDYDNIKSIDVSSTRIWKPDFALYNAWVMAETLIFGEDLKFELSNADRDLSYGVGSCHETNCLVESSGNISCIEPCSYVGHCNSNYNMWPFDRQNCSMIFGPWMNNENETDYTAKSAVVTSGGIAEHTQWKLISTNVVKKLITVSSKDGKFVSSFPNLLYSFVIERHSSLVTKVIGGKTVCRIYSESIR